MSISEDERLSSDGVFPGGLTAVAVIRFILDHEEVAKIEDVADYFRLDVDDVTAALRYYFRHFDRLHPVVGGAR